MTLHSQITREAGINTVGFLLVKTDAYACAYGTTCATVLEVCKFVATQSHPPPAKPLILQ